jgi:hypothetical protein
MAELVAALADLLIFPENPVHTGHRTQVLTRIQQRGEDFARGLILKAFAVQGLPHPHFFFGGERSRRSGGRARFRWTRSTRGVGAAARHAERFAGVRHPDVVGQGFHLLSHFRSGTSGIG